MEMRECTTKKAFIISPLMILHYILASKHFGHILLDMENMAKYRKIIAPPQQPLAAQQAIKTQSGSRRERLALVGQPLYLIILVPQPDAKRRLIWTNLSHLFRRDEQRD